MMLADQTILAEMKRLMDPILINSRIARIGYNSKMDVYTLPGNKHAVANFTDTDRNLPLADFSTQFLVPVADALKAP